MYRAKINNKPIVINKNNYIFPNIYPKIIKVTRIKLVKPIIVRRFLIILPPEILLYICEFLDYKSVANISKTCTELRYLSQLVVTKYFNLVHPFKTYIFGSHYIYVNADLYRKYIAEDFNVNNFYRL